MIYAGYAMLALGLVIVTFVALRIIAFLACWAADSEFKQQYETFWKPVLNMPDNLTAQEIIDRADGKGPQP